MKTLLTGNFEKPAFSDWLGALKKSVKNPDELKKLSFTTDDGIQLNALYTESDISSCPLTGFAPANWEIRQTILADRPGKANELALNALETGADAITFSFEQIPTGKEWQTLSQNIRFDWFPAYFQFHESNSAACFILPDLFTSIGTDPKTIHGGILYDPISAAALAGGFEYSLSETISVFTASVKHLMQEMPHFFCIHPSGIPFREAGANPADELAFMLSSAHQYMEWLALNGIALEEALPFFQFHLGTGSDYFAEIAKYRAFRILWKNLLDRWNLPWQEPTLHVETVFFNKTLYDTHNNLLRTTAETMAAVIGGASAVTVHPMNELLQEPDANSLRWARNIQLIARVESNLDRVSDPAAGSMFIEVLTEKTAQAAWNLMREIEDAGGFCQALIKGMIQQRCGLAAAQRKQELIEGKKVAVGCSKYVNTAEKLFGKITRIYSAPYRKNKLEFVPLQFTRITENLENERLKIENNA